MITSSVGFWRRFLAGILDGLLIGIITFIITGDFDGGNWFTSTFEFLYSLLVPVLWMGYTVGKRIMGIRIVKVNGEKVGIGTMLLRNIVGALVYVLTLGIGLIISAFMVGLRQDHRAIHDMIAGTYVTFEKP